MCFHVLVFLLASLLVLQPVVLNVLFAEQRAAFRAAAPSPDESFRDSPPPPLRLLSQATSGSTGTTQDTSKRTFADGFKAGKIAGKADADDAWFIGGFLFGILGVGAAALIKPGFSNLPQPYWSPDYIAAYEICSRRVAGQYSCRHSHSV